MCQAKSTIATSNRLEITGENDYMQVYDYDYDLIQGKGDACKPAQYIVTLLL